jgi:hypothetical protein
MEMIPYNRIAWRWYTVIKLLGAFKFIESFDKRQFCHILSTVKTLYILHTSSPKSPK